ncbi:hypothetical protein SAMN05216466_10134 [Paraburkholderia phenazinium]|uniref:Uncharacterized protein n=1 Tax=Paraburkholderia phenazinium TaxID=60549 RepID=A0A1G7NTZ0_9BURK|nr:hypothetical protein SAMN05216466_10134 [Paraburkholderia phenazinium]
MTSIACATRRRIRRVPFPAPVSRASQRRVVQDNPDLPVAFVADTLVAMAEARARTSIARPASPALAAASWASQPARRR